jgi:hypothetical protein
MKNKKQLIVDYSPIALRSATRHQLSPPTKFFVDRKKRESKILCRTFREV